MTKRLTFFIMFLLFIGIVSAGKTYDLDFTENPAYVVGLNEGDRIEFRLNGFLHTILIKKITKESVNVATFTNIEDEDRSLKVPYYSTLNKQKFLKLDLEKDGKPDILVLYQGSNSTSASVLFQLPIGPDKDLEVFSESQFKKDNFLKNLLYFFVVLIAIFSIIFLILKRKARKSVEAVKEENKAE